MSIFLSRPVAKIYPNGEFTIGADSVKRMDAEHIRSAPQRVENMFWGALDDRVKSECKAIASDRVMGSAIGSSLVANSPKKRRGLKGISRRASRDVRNMAFLLQRENHKKRLGFITLTLPELEAADMVSVTENWHQVVKEFFKTLGRQYEATAGKKFEHVCVTELQEKRYERSGFVGLHLHFIYVGRFSNKAEWILSKYQIRDAWKTSVEKHCTKTYDFNSSENCQSVRKSAENYLGKYLTKGVKAVAKVVAKGFTECLPRTWYSRSLSLLRRVKSKVKRSHAAGDYLSRKFTRRLTLNTVSFYKEITIDTPSRDGVVVGYVGKFKPSIDILNAKDIVGLIALLETKS